MEQLDKTKTELAIAQQSFSTLNTSAKTYQLYADVTLGWMEGLMFWFYWDKDAQDKWSIKMQTVVSATQNASLITYWETLMNSSDEEHEVAEEAFTELLSQKMIELKPETN